MKKRSILFISLFTIFLLAGRHGFAQEESKYGTDSVKCITNNSLYYEFFKQWKQSNYKSTAWKDAIKPWRWVFIHCPQSTINIYLHGEKLVEELINQESNKEKKEKYIDTLMMVYDKRIQYFGKEGYVLGKKGVDLYKLRPNDYEEVYEILKKSIALEGTESNGPVLIYYFRAAEKMVKAEKSEKTILVDIYDQTSEIVEFNIKKYNAENDTENLTNWENIKGNIELSFEPYATCEDLISIYTIKFNETPKDVDLLKKITKILEKKDCTDSELFFKATKNLHEAEPSARTAELMGIMNIKKEDYNAAAKYLNESINLFEDDMDKADAYFLLANVYFQLKQYSNARNASYEALKITPNEGKLYILIGDLYASSAKDCGDNDLTSKAAYWVAVDKYIRAKSVDPSVEELANTKINTFSQYFPLKETIFFYDLNEGDSYIVECWINEKTTVRTSD
ncbi:MAG: tetratricopeptide repeat protein [Bacteroidales bacterium]|nr:tetratricopeptide repeat protein [Bacteroidales bacterium]